MKKPADDYRKLDLRLLEENTDEEGRCRVPSMAEKFPSKSRETKRSQNIRSKWNARVLLQSRATELIDSDELCPESFSQESG